MLRSTALWSLSAALLLGTGSCERLKEIGIDPFPAEDDVELGRQVAEQIAADPDTYPILSEVDFPDAYGHIQRIMASILNSPDLDYVDVFAYDSIKIIHDDEVLNAFATPGGYIYVYTGLIKYLDTEDQLAGVLGHEIAHAEKRHGTDALIRQLGAQTLLDVVLGDNSENQIAQVLTGLVQLQFGREAEEESDEWSVIYLSATNYQCNGAAGFFQKLEEQGAGGGGPEFLSTHPSPDNRITDINAKATEEGCDTTPLNPDTYAAFKASLPE